jgi:MFS family permease
MEHGMQSSSDGEGSFHHIESGVRNEIGVQSQNFSRRMSSGDVTNSCSGSGMDSVKDQLVSSGGDIVAAISDVKEAAMASVDVKVSDQPTSQKEAETPDAQKFDGGGDLNPTLQEAQLEHRNEAQKSSSHGSNVLNGSDDVSDISHSDSEPSKEDWVPLNDAHTRRSFTICSVITNPSDHGSIQSLRESVDRVLMSSHNSMGGVGRPRSNSRDCMQKYVTPTVAQMFYDQNYYRSADWLRFVPRRNSSIGENESGSDIMSSAMGSSSQSPVGHHGNLTPDRYYRGFDNTRIRVGFHHPGYGRTIVRRQDMQEAMSHGDLSAPAGQVTNFRLEHSNLAIDAPISEEDAGAYGRGGSAAFCGNTKTIPSSDVSNISHLPLKEINCDPNHESCQVVLGEEYEIQADELGSMQHNPEAAMDIKIQSFRSSLRKGAIRRPTSSNGSGPNRGLGNVMDLPEHIREEQMHLASWDSKYQTYACRVDQSQDDRAVEIPVFSMGRPHMRAFHFAWMSFFFVFLAWFAIAPLLAEIQESLGLTKEQIWTSSIFSVAGGLVTRCLMGVLCDIYGARLMSAAILFTCGVPTCFTGLVNSSVGLSILRLVIGTGGSAFVTCQYWTSTMFTREVAGTANALAAGWGNLGGGVTMILTGSVLFPFFEWIYRAAGTERDPSELAWRTCCIIPGLICIVFTFIVIRSADDSPKGNYQKRKRLGLMQKDSAMNHVKSAVMDLNTWLLLIQYGCCFGVEITTSNALSLYFIEKFELSTASGESCRTIPFVIYHMFLLVN